MDKQRLIDNLKRVRDNIAQACIRKNRDPKDVRLVAVTKSVDVDVIRMLLELGQLDLGESRVQDFLQRQARIREFISRHRELTGAPLGEISMIPRWHMIGHLQRNKVKPILAVTEMIHSVDSLRLAEEINTAAAKLGLSHKVKILLEVNTSQERQKYGLAVGAVGALAEQIQTLPNLKIMGLMTMAPQTENQETARFCFVRLREIFDELRGEGIVDKEFRHLSMGMSQDYVAAVEEGATLVRVGTALFA